MIVHWERVPTVQCPRHVVINTECSKFCSIVLSWTNIRVQIFTFSSLLELFITDVPCSKNRFKSNQFVFVIFYYMFLCFHLSIGEHCYAIVIYVCSSMCLGVSFRDVPDIRQCRIIRQYFVYLESGVQKSGSLLICKLGTEIVLGHCSPCPPLLGITFVLDSH